MIETANYNKTYNQIDFSKENLQGKEFDGCQFINCSFAESNLSATDFLNCDFQNCNLMMVQTNETGLKDVRFKGCKLVGLDFSLCNDFLFLVNFSHCQLDYALFTKKKMKKTHFSDCSLLQVDFSACVLTGSSFENCVLTGTTFYRTNLEETDFRSARDFLIDPDENRVKKAKFSVWGLPGLLTKYAIEIETI